MAYKGGKCIVCGYSNYFGSMHFHHIDSSSKEFEINSGRAAMSWEKIKKELDKCVLLCANHHGELHGGVINLSPGSLALKADA